MSAVSFMAHDKFLMFFQVEGPYGNQAVAL
jgi:hypothetical protein